MVIVLMGVSGVGKTVVGERAADRLGWRFVDADALHPAANVAKMQAGHPLDDEDRRPWLLAVRRTIAEAVDAGRNTIVACSALKGRYRQVLAEGLPDVRFVHLAADASTIRQRLRRRRDHFMPGSLLDSQLADLEPPADAETLDATAPVEALVETVVALAGVDGLTRREGG